MEIHTRDCARVRVNSHVRYTCSERHAYAQPGPAWGKKGGGWCGAVHVHPIPPLYNVRPLAP